MSHHNHDQEECINIPVVEEDAPEAASAAPQETDVEALEADCKERICPSCTVAAEAEEVRLRALAEMENFKKRLQREKDEQARYATDSVLSDLLPTLDNLDLALQYGSQSEACKDMLTGVDMTRRLLLDAVKKHGLEPVGAVGDAFDPELHEAIAQEESADVPPGHILQIMQKGYKLKDRLLRPAKVMVSAKPSKHVSVQV